MKRLWLLLSCALMVCAMAVHADAATVRFGGDTSLGSAGVSARDSYFLTEIAGRLPATDSAAAATALATGIKTERGNVNWASGDAAGGALETITEQLRASHGFAVGIVSTVPFNHATPAGFAAHNRSRYNYAALAHEIIFETTPEVVVSGGFESALFGADNPDYGALIDGSTPYSHVVVRQEGVDGATALGSAAATVALADGDRLFGLFGDAGGNLTYHDVADAPGNPSVNRSAIEDPTLADVVSSVLPVLDQDPDGFFVLFEQGDIDWANHANNYQRMVGGVYDLEQAVVAAQQYVETSPTISWTNTLMIVTADHANSHMRLRRPDLLQAGDLPTQIGRDSAWNYPDGEVSYRTTGHTNELVTLWARGLGSDLFNDYAGSWYPGTRIVDNTQINTVMRRAVAERGVEHLLLFVGDGMQAEHEIAGSLYLYGQEMALAWHAWPHLEDGWAGYCSTWDVSTYAQYASVRHADAYAPDNSDAALGYDPLLGGCAPYPLHCFNHLPQPYAPHDVHLPLITRISEPLSP